MEKEATRDIIPHLVSIGPNHYGNLKFSDMETQKTELLDLESREWNSQKASSLTNALLELEEKTRKCYPHSFNHMDGNAFVRMMLTDAFFLINLFTDYPKFRKFWVDNASTLRSKGVTFIARDREARLPLDIEFSWLGLLRIPTFYMDERIVRVLKNLLAYEQGSRQVKPYFSCVAVFFSNIATTKRDVKFLREAGIIQHQLHSDKKVVSLLQVLYEAVEFSSDQDCLLKCEVERINRYAASVPGKFISYVKRILLPKFVPFVVLFVTLFLSLSPADTLKPFKIRA
nr:UPF0481 protein At3g47200-like [Ipomoea batatas]